MSKKFVPLIRSAHEELRLGRDGDFSFSVTETAAPIVLGEMAVVAREYPILFPETGGLPFALLGMKPETNEFLNDRGGWHADYVPLYIRQYPFSLLPIVKGNTDGQMRLCVDSRVEDTQELEGERVFNGKGDLSDTASKRVDCAKKLIAQAALTRRQVEVLEETSLLKAHHVQMRLITGEVKNVTGFRAVDEDALNALEEEAFLGLRNKGVLPLIYAHLMSLANLKHGVLAQQTGNIVGKSARDVEKPVVNLDAYVDEDGDLQLDY